MPETNAVSPPAPSASPDAVRSNLEAILASRVFSNSERLRRFLRFLVERTLAGQTDDLKEYTIGLEVFDRDPTYDPRVDSTVRVHAGKLRDRLREYHLGEGRHATVRIEIPKGTYVPVFTLQGPGTAIAPPDGWHLLRRVVLVGGVAVTAFLAGVALMHFRPPAPPISLHQVTFRRGMISAARFGPDGNNIVYSAAFEGQPLEIFATRPEAPDSRSLGISPAHLLAVGPTGEIAAAVRTHYNGFFQFLGTLARASLTGGVPRELLSDIVAADWSRDGSKLAVVKQVPGRNRLESPPGHLLFEGPQLAWIGDVRFSPDGKWIAFLVHPLRGDNLGSLFVCDLAGNAHKLSGEWAGIQGVAWTPGGREIWIAADEANAANTIRAVDLSGRERVVWRGADTIVVHDISKTGRALVAMDNIRLHVMALPPGESAERELSWLDGGCSCGLSADGKTLLIGEAGIGGGPHLSAYLRPTSGSPAVRLGDGSPLAISPDGAWVLAYRHDSPQRPVFLPTGAGDVRSMSTGNIRFLESGAWLPDSRRVLLIGREPNHPLRTYVAALDGGAPAPLTPEGISGVSLSSDGKAILVRDRSAKWLVFHIGDGSMTPVTGAAPDLIPFAWSNTRDVVYARMGDIPARIFRLNVRTGEREFWRELKPADPAGAIGLQHIQITPAGNAYAYTYFQFNARLFVVDGLK